VLTQFRIKRLLAYSTVSNIGFILLALSVNTIESIQAFIFYLMQYSISNLNIFMIIVAIGYSFYCYISGNKEHEELLEKNNSPVQIVNQLRGYFYINPVLSLTLAITIFSFIGVPPLIGFFAKQMVLSAALENGYIFISLLAVFTSVIAGVYYLNIIKEVFFYLPDHKINPLLKNFNISGSVFDRRFIFIKSLTFSFQNVAINSSISVIISIITLIISLFIFSNRE
jgi:NADH-ubiquinone oxidoreductase chain 2